MIRTIDSTLPFQVSPLSALTRRRRVFEMKTADARDRDTTTGEEKTSVCWRGGLPPYQGGGGGALLLAEARGRLPLGFLAFLLSGRWRREGLCGWGLKLR